MKKYNSDFNANLYIPIVEIIRLEESNHGTFGALKINKQFMFVTLEPNDILNKKNHSSIPAQQYICEQIKSPSHGIVYEIMDVPERTDVQFHIGNVIADTKACVLVGEKIGCIENKKAVINSKKAFNDFMYLLRPYKKFHLTIKECY